MNKQTVFISKNVFRLLLITVLLGILSACTKDSASPPANEVWISGSTFNPSSISVALNTTIKWTNKDGIAHTVTSDAGLFDSGNMNSNSTFSHQFTTAGSFNYHCTYHSMMIGTVIVH
jgi:plastocyanin